MNCLSECSCKEKPEQGRPMLTKCFSLLRRWQLINFFLTSRRTTAFVVKQLSSDITQFLPYVANIQVCILINTFHPVSVAHDCFWSSFKVFDFHLVGETRAFEDYQKYVCFFLEKNPSPQIDFSRDRLLARWSLFENKITCFWAFIFPKH